MCYEHYLTTIFPCFDPCVLNFQVVFAILQELRSIVEVVQCEQKSFEKMVVNVRFESFFPSGYIFKICKNKHNI